MRGPAHLFRGSCAQARIFVAVGSFSKRRAVRGQDARTRALWIASDRKTGNHEGSGRPTAESYRYRYRQRRAATERRGVAGQGRLARTVALGALALLAVLFYLIREIGLDPAELRDYLLVSLMFVGTAIVCGLVVGALIMGVRRLRRSAGRDRHKLNATAGTDDPDAA